MTTVSVIICTRNRAHSLRETLASIAKCVIPVGLSAELLVVDNGSTDSTADVVRKMPMPDLALRYTQEPRKGQSFARNRGVRESKGDIILFTDDDVRPPVNWIDGMCRLILKEKADAVAGGVALAPHLWRDGLGPVRTWLACTDGINPNRPERMVGANMAFARRVLNNVPTFDTELGPGALGFSDDTLFSWQLMEAGYCIKSALDITAEHHPAADRLRRPMILNTAERLSRSDAYVDYHWHHERRVNDRRSLLHRWAAVNVRRIVFMHQWIASEIPPEWEIDHIFREAYRDQFRRECGRPRNYERRGFLKKDHRSAAVAKAQCSPPD